MSFQTISKLENSVCAPDISMLPKLSVYFGVTIDEMFDLTTEQRLHRIEKMLDMEREQEHLKEKFGFTEGEPVRKMLEKKQKLYGKMGRESK